MSNAQPHHLTSRVKTQYELFPYPHYPLFLPLRTQEAFASNSLFAARVLEQSGFVPAIRQDPKARVLLAGCGDIFPAMAMAWEPRGHPLTALDLSSASLRRARLRCLLKWRETSWVEGNLEDPALALPNDLAHIDCFGVLHHLANPSAVLQRFAAALLPGGTLRVMVYNSAARHWLTQIQRAFALLGLEAGEAQDIVRGKIILELLARISPALRNRLSPLRDITWKNTSRMVDTFFHAREARLGLGFWWGEIEAAGLRILGAYDRCGELDDLPNPLLAMPPRRDWEERIADRRYENHFEFYLARTDGAPMEKAGKSHAVPPAVQYLSSPTRTWFAYEETRHLPWLMRERIWLHFLRRLAGQTDSPKDGWMAKLPPAAIQRLGRLGAIFPDDCASAEIKDLLRRPMQDFMERPDALDKGAFPANRELRSLVQGILQEKGRPETFLEIILQRFQAAQRGL